MALRVWRNPGWDPFEEMSDVQERINRLFDDTFGRYPSTRQETFERGWSPPVDIYEDKERIVVQAELPGTKKSDITIEVHDNVLTISGERKLEEGVKREDYHRIERSYGRFSRAFSLPSSVKADNVKATYKDGILEIILPKVERVKAIPINVEP